MFLHYSSMLSSVLWLNAHKVLESTIKVHKIINCSHHNKRTIHTDIFGAQFMARRRVSQNV